MAPAPPEETLPVPPQRPGTVAGLPAGVLRDGPRQRGRPVLLSHAALDDDGQDQGLLLGRSTGFDPRLRRPGRSEDDPSGGFRRLASLITGAVSGDGASAPGLSPL